MIHEIKSRFANFLLHSGIMSPLKLGRDKVNTLTEPTQGFPPFPMQLSHIPRRDFLPPTDSESFCRYVLALGDKHRLDDNYTDAEFDSDLQAVIDTPRGGA